MKRMIVSILTIFLIASLLLGCSIAFAQGKTITLRNGITFGMTKEAVLARETAIRDKTITASKECGYLDVTIAGIENSNLYYLFNNANRLYRVHIYFQADKQYIREATAISDYTSINNMLMSKYGRPLGNRNGYTHSVQTQALKSHLRYVSLTELLIEIRGSGKLIEHYDEWVVQVDGGYVKIDHVLTYLHGTEGNACTHELDYTFYTNTEWNQIIQSFSNGL